MRNDNDGCGSPPELSLGELRSEYKDQNNFSAGDVVKYACQPGYLKHPGVPFSITCLESGEWTEAPDICKRKSCGHPEEPQNGRVIVQSDILFGATVNYTCEEGHRLVGQPQRHCQLSQQRVAWSGEVPVCQRIPCPLPPEISHGGHSQPLKEGFYYGSAVIYVCDLGYQLTGEASIYCKTEDGQTGVWSGPLPECAVVQCPPPPAIANGKHSAQALEAFPSGTSVHYSCDPGYSLFRRGFIHCTESGTWSLPYPQCTDGCGDPPKLSFAKLRNESETQNGFPVGKSVSFACLPGYSKVPGLSHIITCLQNRTWSEAPEFCKRKSCAHLEEPENGRVIVGTDLLFGSTVNYICEEGYVLIGQPQRQCELSAKHVAWSGNAPICQIILCPPPPSILHGKHNRHLKEEFSYGSSVTYTCSGGYQLIGEDFIYCTTKDGQTGVWNGPPPQCTEVQCLPAPTITNGKHNGQAMEAFTSGMSVRYRCDPGYSLIGEAQLHCTASGAWSHPAPQCKVSAIGCVAPVVQNGRVAVRKLSYRPGDTVTVECDPGYILKGTHVSQCQAGGTWDPPVPSCATTIQCLPPPAIANGKHSAKPTGTFNSGTSVLYTCKPGYALVGVASTYCTVSGSWSRPLPRCTAVSCESPEIENGGVIEFQPVYRPGDIVEVGCDDGYIPTSTQKSQCQFGGRWDPPVPGCESERELRLPEM
ncbi:complement receptor type 1-like [Alligator sinensis]|uniref:Complement receptor type 1-like n=1 Tax=Alligator sinensis TaxID=38654 RepID=A0A3Q0FUN3_ALLSI|nr:complement receptor type 1-like [Alligator sinensis]